MLTKPIKRCVIAVAVLALVAACSDSGSKELSKDDFLKQGNAICDAGNKTIESSASSAFPNNAQPSPDQIRDFVQKTLAPSIRKQLDDIDKLKPPKDLQGKVDKLLTDARAALAVMEQKAKDDPQSIFEQDPFADVNKQARDLGLTVCGSDEGSSDSGSASS
jgi:hypothetical protein